MSVINHKILQFNKELRDIQKIIEKVTHFTPLHPSAINLVLLRFELTLSTSALRRPERDEIEPYPEWSVMELTINNIMSFMMIVGTVISVKSQIL